MARNNKFSSKPPQIVRDPITGERVENGRIYNDALALIGRQNYFGVGEPILDTPRGGTDYSAQWRFGARAISATFVNHKYDPASFPEGRQEFAVYRVVLLGAFAYSKSGGIRGSVKEFLFGDSYSDSEFGAGGDPSLFPSVIPDRIEAFKASFRFSSVQNCRDQIQAFDGAGQWAGFSSQEWVQGGDRSMLWPESVRSFPLEFWQHPFSLQHA